MADEHSNPSWFEFRIEETEGLGVEAAKLSKLLADISSALYAIARAKLGKEAARPGPRTPDEEALAAIRIIRVVPGSAIIEADPPAAGLQSQFEFGLDVTSEDVLFDFALEAQRIAKHEPSEFHRPEVRRRIHEVLKDAGEIGARSEVVIRPRGSRRPAAFLHESELRIQLPRTSEADVIEGLPSQPRRRRLSGHAYMVDVEPGRFRIRLKLPDGRDLTLDANEELATILRGAVDRVVEIEAVEEVQGDQVASRLAVDIALLPTSGSGSAKPPKSIEELAVEQGFGEETPDYEALATAVWETDEQFAEFDEYLRRVRQVASQ